MSVSIKNQSAEGTGGLGIIRGNNEEKLSRDSNVEFANLHCNNKNKKKIIIKSCDSRDSNPGYMGSKFTKISTTLWRPMQITDKNNQLCNPHQRKSNALGKHSVAAKSMP